MLGDDKAHPTGSTLPKQTVNALLSTGSGRIIITACRENQVSFIGRGEYTLFAQALVDGLRGAGEEIPNRGGTISVFDLYTHLHETVKQQVEHTIAAHSRIRYGGMQEPELTVLKGVGPFAVALYRGAATLGEFPDHPTATHTVVRVVEPERSQRAFQNITGTANMGRDNDGHNVSLNTGTMAQNNQTINNQAPSQGAQGNFHGPVTFNQPQTTFNQQGQQVQGSQYNTNRDIIQTGGDYVGGDKIDAQGSQGFINRPTGPVQQQFGDTVLGDTMSRNITTGNISGSGIAIGHKSQAQVQIQQSSDQETSAYAFTRVYEAITTRPPDPDVDKDEITETVQDIEQEAEKCDQANEKKLTRWLRNLAAIAPDIFEVTVEVLKSPAATFARVDKKEVTFDQCNQIVLGCQYNARNIVFTGEPTPFERDVVTKTSKEFMEMIQKGVYDIMYIEKYLLDSTEEIQIRLMTLELYMLSGLWNYDVLATLGRDFSQSLREQIMHNIMDYELLHYDHTTLIANMRDSMTNIAEHAARATQFLIQCKSACPDLFIQANIQHHRYWLIRLIAVRSIIEADLPESLMLLYEFRNSKYWVTRRKILKYINERYERHQLGDEYYDKVISILEGYITDGHSSDKTRKIAEELLIRIRKD